MALYQGDVMNTLSYLLGERTVPTTGTEGRKDFVQKALEEVYRAYPWKFAESTVTLSVVSGIASLPSNYTTDFEPFVRYYDSNSTPVDQDQVFSSEQDQVNIGDNKFWLTPTSDGLTMLLNTKEVISNVVVTYQQAPPTLGASVATPYDNGMVVALGAKRYVKMSQDPEADISQDEDLFQKKLQDSIRQKQLSQPRIRRRSVQSDLNVYTGQD